jgi:hypothetical protein
MCSIAITIKIRIIILLKISDKLWDKMSDLMQDEKPYNTIVRIAIHLIKYFKDTLKISCVLVPHANVISTTY